MKCSECSKEILPIVAVDVDGTLGDYHTHFIQFLQRYIYYEEVDHQLLSPDFAYDGSRPFSTWCCNYYGISLEDYRTIKLAYRQGGMKRTMPIFENATWLCQKLKWELGVELWITTTRPYLSLDNVVPDTVAWLAHHQITYDGMLFDEDKYAQLARRVDSQRVIAVLDDLPEMLNAAAHVLYYGHDVPILIRGHYNRAVQAMAESTLCDVFTTIKERIPVWEAQTRH